MQKKEETNHLKGVKGYSSSPFKWCCVRDGRTLFVSLSSRAMPRLLLTEFRMSSALTPDTVSSCPSTSGQRERERERKHSCVSVQIRAFDIYKYYI